MARKNAACEVYSTVILEEINSSFTTHFIVSLTYRRTKSINFDFIKNDNTEAGWINNNLDCSSIANPTSYSQKAIKISYPGFTGFSYFFLTSECSAVDMASSFTCGSGYPYYYLAGLSTNSDKTTIIIDAPLHADRRQSPTETITGSDLVINSVGIDGTTNLPDSDYPEKFLMTSERRTSLDGVI